ncbi:MAG: PspA/IM30 family protein [Ruminococcus sp.]|nr:PspA/IM30 family protein [Ruminococcus sp.]
MDIFEKLLDFVEKNFSDPADKSESPERTVTKLIADMHGELDECINKYGKIRASERLIYRKYQDALKISQIWENKAKSALNENNRTLAEQALEKKINADESVKTYEKMYNTVSAQAKAAAEQVEILRNRLETAKAKRAALVARSQAADIKKQLAKTLGGFDKSGAADKFSRFEEEVRRKEAEADAIAEIADDFSVGKNTDEILSAFEKNDRIDSEIARLMAETDGEKTNPKDDE